MYKWRSHFLWIFMITCVLCAHASAEIINKITVRGNKRVPDSSIIAYSELAVGLDIDQQDLKNAIRQIYSKKLFSHVAITIKQSTVTITVKEYPIIRKVDVKKNKLIPEEGLNEILKKTNLEAGEVLNPVKLNEFKHALRAEYRLNGFPDVTIADKVNVINGGMVDLEVIIMKGPQYQVRKMRINGNLAFTDRTLFSKMSLGTPSLYARIFGGNYYSKLAFEKSKNDLRNFYIEEGFLGFVIDDVSITKVPNAKFVDIEISVNEGPRFMFGDIRIQGDKEAESVDVRSINRIKSGVANGVRLPFSRRDVFQLQQDITSTLERMNYPVKAVTPRCHRTRKTRRLICCLKSSAGSLL